MPVVPPCSDSNCIQLIPIMFMLTPWIELGISTQMFCFAKVLNKPLMAEEKNPMAENPLLKY